MRILFAAAFMCATFSAAVASGDWGRDFDFLIAEPGTKVTFGKNNQGDETREIRLASGVIYTQVRHDGKVARVFDNDASGHGAVLCAYWIYLELRAAASRCDPKPGEATAMDTQLKRIEDFMVLNGLQPRAPAGPAARAQITALKAKVDAEFRSVAPDKRAAICQNRDIAKLLSGYRSEGEAKLRKQVDDLLSVPRPAVLNPCL